jgi:cell pole-organizing protein PopZ
MANPSTAHEPSMEEILASIRQIISEDGDGGGGRPLRAALLESRAGGPGRSGPARAASPRAGAIRGVPAGERCRPGGAHEVAAA